LQGSFGGCQRHITQTQHDDVDYLNHLIKEDVKMLTPGALKMPYMKLHKYVATMKHLSPQLNRSTHNKLKILMAYKSSPKPATDVMTVTNSTNQAYIHVK
jgi:hypothetical protein